MLKKPSNENYCANVVKIKNIIELEGMNTIAHTNIYGNMVILSKNTEIDTIGLFFPLETQLCKEFLHNNNLYRKKELNRDNSKKGFFEDNGRVRCQKFQGYKSMGFFIGLSAIDFAQYNKELKEGDCFDELNGVKICNKYIVKQLQSNVQGNSNKGKKRLEKISKLIDGQFKFHESTAQLGKNIQLLKPNDIISITKKMHGSSFVSSNILCKRKLNSFERILKFIGVNINDTEYDNIYSSRKVIKNDDLNPNKNNYYSEDIWGIVNTELKSYLSKGMTIYGEVVGYLSTGAMIQKCYNYGCEPREHAIYIYRITMTNHDGQVFEFSAKQVQDWCEMNGLCAVPELYYGRIDDLYKTNKEEHYHENLLEFLQNTYLEKDCNMCKIPNTPDEGIVLRIEANDLRSYKLKSFRFFEKETRELDKGLVNIEDN